MKKIINGRKYDTETAIEIDSFDDKLGSSNFRHIEETLYRKKTGEFFLYGSGGPASKYRVTIGTNWWSGGESIVPLTDDEAKEWAEQHMSAEAYESLFGVVEE